MLVIGFMSIHSWEYFWCVCSTSYSNYPGTHVDLTPESYFFSVVQAGNSPREEFKPSYYKLHCIRIK